MIVSSKYSSIEGTEKVCVDSTLFIKQEREVMW